MAELIVDGGITNSTPDAVTITPLTTADRLDTYGDLNAANYSATVTHVPAP